MSEFEPGQPGRGADAADCDALAAKLLAAARVLCALNVEPDVRIRLNLRFMAICASLKMPAASRNRGARRLDRLMADAERASRGEQGRRE